LLLFADAGISPVLLLIAGDLRRVALNRLECGDTETASRRVKLSHITKSIFYKCCYNDFSAILANYRIARQLYPKRYHDVVSVPKSYCVKIDLDSKWPSFSISENNIPTRNSKVFWPFASRKSAQEFIDNLEQAFCLCKQSCLIDKPEKAISCPYYQMNTCNAPCLGKTSREEYFKQIDSAVEAACGRVEQFVPELNKLMKQYAASMQFEQAQTIKSRLSFLSKLKDDQFKWVSELNELKLLHIDITHKAHIKGQKKKVQNYAAFLITAGRINRLNEFSLDHVNDLVQNITACSCQVSEQADNYEIFTEESAFISYALYRSKPAGIWIDLRDGIDIQQLVSEISRMEEQKTEDLPEDFVADTSSGSK
jgi:excinuclease UvrABC nuclease subunit